MLHWKQKSKQQPSADCLPKNNKQYKAAHLLIVCCVATDWLQWARLSASCRCWGAGGVIGLRTEHHALQQHSIHSGVQCQSRVAKDMEGDLDAAHMTC